MKPIRFQLQQLTFLGLLAALLTTSLTAKAINKGEDLPSDLRASSVVIMLAGTAKDQVGGGCSYVVVGPRHLLTAGHCGELVREGQSVNAVSSDKKNIEENTIEKIVFHAKYEKGTGDQKPQGEAEVEKFLAKVPTDIALIRLKETIKFPVQPIPLVADEQDGKPTVLISNGPNGDIKGGISFSVPVKTGGYAYRNSQKKVVSLPLIRSEIQKSDSGACHADSGGGLFIFQNQRWELMGIMSTVENISNQKCGTSQNDVLIVPVLDNLQWLKPELTGANG